jgi:hypothetical protein
VGAWCLRLSSSNSHATYFAHSMSNEKAPDVEQAPAPELEMDVEEPLKQQQPPMQEGVRLAEAVTLSWTKTSLTIIYIW